MLWHFCIAPMYQAVAKSCTLAKLGLLIHFMQLYDIMQHCHCCV